MSVAGRPGHVWIDGRIVSAEGPHLSAFDRGFQLGDGVFETLRVRGGHPTELEEHTARLRRSATGLGIVLAAELETTLAGGIADLLAAEGMGGPDGDASVRITISRGAFTGRGLLPPDEDVAPTAVIQAWPVVPPPAGHLERGLHVIVSAVRRDPENPLAALKTTSRADYVYARIEARGAGADDALILTVDGFLSEATTANVFLVRGERLATPSLACAILPGHDALVDPRLGRAGRPQAGRGVAHRRRSRRGGRGVPLQQRGRHPAGHPARRCPDRHGPAGAMDATGAGRPGGLHRRRGTGVTAA